MTLLLNYRLIRIFAFHKHITYEKYLIHHPFQHSHHFL